MWATLTHWSPRPDQPALTQRLLADVPLRGPGEHVVEDAAGGGHPVQPEVRGQADQAGDQVAFQLWGAGLFATGVGEAVQELGVLVHFHQQRGE